jgi:hypothetical protein
MTNKFHTQGQFNQDWTNYIPQVDWDDIDIEILLQDIMCPVEEQNLDIARDMLTRIGIQC